MAIEYISQEFYKESLEQSGKTVRSFATKSNHPRNIYDLLKTAQKSIFYQFFSLVVVCIFILVSSAYVYWQSQSQHEIILYRIIGNSLPPRHDHNQSIINIKFMLQNEDNFENTQKVFVLNRIVNKSIEQELLGILKDHQMEMKRLRKSPPRIAIIPFKKQEYLQQGSMSYETFPEGYLYSDSFKLLGRTAKMIANDQTLQHKNNYIMNNNGARNWCINEGKRILENYSAKNKWIFPLDGNSFFTRQSWDQIQSCIQQASEKVQYIVVPMQRILNNQDLLKESFQPDPKDEPQIIFRHDSELIFNPQMRYGRRSKIELLWRLGVLNVTDKYIFFPWERRPDIRPVDKEKVLVCGWIARLFSGKPDQEASNDDLRSHTSRLRNYNRMLGIKSQIDSIDRQTFASQHKIGNLISLNSTSLISLSPLLPKQQFTHNNLLKVVSLFRSDNFSTDLTKFYYQSSMLITLIDKFRDVIKDSYYQKDLFKLNFVYLANLIHNHNFLKQDLNLKAVLIDAFNKLELDQLNLGVTLSKNVRIQTSLISLSHALDNSFQVYRLCDKFKSLTNFFSQTCHKIVFENYEAEDLCFVQSFLSGVSVCSSIGFDEKSLGISESIDKYSELLKRSGKLNQRNSAFCL